MSDLAGILVSLDVRIAGRYSFGTNLGLTDRSGEAAITGAQLEADFERNQHLFPMDLKVPLAECDSVVGVKVSRIAFVNVLVWRRGIGAIR
jgi:hypothetical protein